MSAAGNVNSIPAYPVATRSTAAEAVVGPEYGRTGRADRPGLGNTRAPASRKPG
jgi:hypothetical protein